MYHLPQGRYSIGRIEAKQVGGVYIAKTETKWGCKRDFTNTGERTCDATGTRVKGKTIGRKKATRKGD